MKKVLFLVLFVILCITLFAGCVSKEDELFKEAVSILEENGTQPYGDMEITYYEIADDESYIKIDTNPYDIDDFFVEEADQLVKDVNSVLGFSSSLYEKMGATTALDGRQSDENDYFVVSWTFHPDNGLNILYEKK